MTLYVGTSGWAYPEWKPAFYPAGVGRTRFLEHYSRSLSSCEINATFYRVQERTTIQRWSEATHESFRFAIKAHRRLTHSRALVLDDAGEEFLARFVESLVPLGRRLGVVLFQFPPHRIRDDPGLRTLISVLPSNFVCAFEFRHESWQAPEVAELVAERGHAVCLSDTAGQPPDRLPAGTVAYVRLRADRYGPRRRAAWRALLEGEAARRAVYVFTKHKDAPAGDPFTGVGLAQWLNAARQPAP